jgi:outer membrane protein TolC
MQPMYRVLLFTSGLVLSAAAWGQSPPAPHPTALRFEAAIAQAVRAAPTVGAREFQTVAAREEAARAAALPDPMLTGGIDNLTATGSKAFDFAADDQTMKRVGITQVFPARAKRQALQGAADRRIDEARALVETEQLAVRRAAAQAWVDLWAAEREAAELRRLRSQTGIAVSVAKARLSGGTGTAVEALATRAGALELENRISAAEAQVTAARDSLARWLDLSPEDVRIEGDPPDLMSLPVSEATLLGSIDKQGPLLPWASREAVAEAEVTVARAQKKPDWSLGASYGQRSGGRSDMVTLEFSIDLPLFTVNRQDRGIAARRADLDSVMAQHAEARREQTETVRRLLAQWQGLRQQVERKEHEMLPLARDRAEIAVASYRGGGDLQPWLEARRDEIELHIEHARHLGELGRVWAALAYLLPSPGEHP